MGRMLSVWSGTQKAGKTVFIYSLINQMMEDCPKNMKVLVCCTNLRQGNLLKLFNISDEELNLEDAVNIKMSSGAEINIFNALAKKDNIYFIGTRKTGEGYARQHIGVYEEIIEDLKERFDLVVIDAMAGRESTLTNMVLQKSDCIVNMMCQDKESLDGMDMKNEKDICYVVNKYINIYPDKKSLSSIYKLKRPVYTLPFCKSLLEMKNRDKLDCYIQHESQYNLSVKEILPHVYEETGISLESGKRRESNMRGFLKSILVKGIGGAQNIAESQDTGGGR